MTRHYDSLMELLRFHRTGYAVKHQPHPLFDDEAYYTWHRIRLSARKALQAIPPVADERIIDIQEFCSHGKPSRS